MHKLYRIELEDMGNTDITYLYAENKADAIVDCLSKMQINLDIKSVHAADKRDLLDAAIVGHSYPVTKRTI